MDGNFEIDNPFRSPQWRYERVMALLRNRTSPRRSDGRPIRVYRRFLLSAMAAEGDRRKLAELYEEFPHVAKFHFLRYSPVREPRQILEARLLTSESFDEIAERMGMATAVVELYEQLCFNVRDRMHAKFWIYKAIKGPPSPPSTAKHTEITERKRGFLYRFFAYHGGPLVLDALIAGIGNVPGPQHSEEVPAWFDSALKQMIRTRATAAARAFEFDQNNVMRLLKLAMPTKATSNSSAANAAGQRSWDEHITKITNEFESAIHGHLPRHCADTAPPVSCTNV